VKSSWVSYLTPRELGYNPVLNSTSQFWTRSLADSSHRLSREFSIGLVSEGPSFRLSWVESTHRLSRIELSRINEVLSHESILLFFSIKSSLIGLCGLSCAEKKAINLQVGRPLDRISFLASVINYIWQFAFWLVVHVTGQVKSLKVESSHKA